MSKLAQVVMQVALPCEARPLIDHYRMKKVTNALVTSYHNSDASLHLLVSGVGKVNAAMAIAHYCAMQPVRHHAAFFNIGIAGSSHYSIGQCVMANKIEDASNKQVWYPYLLKKLPCDSATLRCYDQPQHRCTDALVDMESAGFMQAVSRFSYQDQAQLLKVVSDHSAEDHAVIKPQQVQDWIKSALPQIDSIHQALLQRSTLVMQSCVELKEYDAVSDQWRFSHYQQHRLKFLLQRWQVVFKQRPVVEYCHGCLDASAVLKKLERALSNARYRFE